MELKIEIHDLGMNHYGVSVNGQPVTMFNSLGEAQAYVAQLKQKHADNSAQGQIPIDEFDEYVNGPADKRTAYEQAHDAEILQNIGMLPPPSAVYPDLQTPDEPGALAKRNRALDEARARAQGYTDDFISRGNASMGRLGDAYAEADATEAGLYGDYKTAWDGINLPEQSLAAQAYADPDAVAIDKQSLDMLMGAAGGSLDAHTNPEDLARQKQGADKLWGLTDPEVTAQERYLMEVARLGEERSRRSAMDASLRNLQSRGMLGSGGEIGAMLGAQQTTSQNRMIQDLGTQAGAVNRSMEALGLYSDLATQMRNASDRMTTGNMDRRLSGMEGASNVANRMRDSSFNEARLRGVAQDDRDQALADLGVKKANSLFDAGIGVSDAKTGRAESLHDSTISWNKDVKGEHDKLTTWDTNRPDADFLLGLDLLGIKDRLRKSKEAGDIVYGETVGR